MSRRAPGEGSVGRRKGKDGKITWQASLLLPTGKRKYFYGPTRTAVLAKLNEAKKAVADGRSVYSDKQTLATCLTRWLEAKKPEWSPATYKSYAEDIHAKIIPALGNVQLARLTPQQVREFYAELRAKGYAPNTIKGTAIALSAALNQAVKDEILTRNVASVVSVPRGNVRESVAYSADQLRRFLVEIDGTPDEAMFLLLIGTGMRLGELLGLRWRDIDFDRATLTITQAQRAGYEHAEMAQPKTKAARRRIMLHGRLFAALRRHKDAQDDHRQAAGAYREDLGLVFCREDGRPWSQSRFREALFYPTLARAGLPPITPHGLRHSFATLLVESGVPLMIVSGILGHKDIGITANTYTHLDVSSQALAMKALDNIFLLPPGAPEGVSAGE